MSGGMPYGLQAMLKEGHQHMSGMEEAVFRNIEACKQLSLITKTSMGPNGVYPRHDMICLFSDTSINNHAKRHCVGRRHEQDGH